MLNNKGFAVSIILYSISAVIVVVLMLIIAVDAANVHNTINMADQIKEEVKNNGVNDEILDGNLLKFKNAILTHNTIITDTPTLTNSSNNTSDESGLYKSTATNSGKPTYYFRGNVTNNYVKFAGYTWRIVRINEDGTVRLIMQDGINNSGTYINTTYTYVLPMYYSNSSSTNGAKNQLNSWYTTNVVNKGYSDIVVTGNYYCEQAKAGYDNSFATNSGAGMLVYSDYKPNFKCSNDGNNRGIVNASVGLLSYDEVVHAGGYSMKKNNQFYLYNSAIEWWTMSPAGFNNYAIDWTVSSEGTIGFSNISNNKVLRPVINLKGDVIVTGTGTSADPYVISSLKDNVLADNTLITTTPTLTNSSNNTSDVSGLYKSTATNSGKPTYYFRGNVENNYVNFAGFTWRIVRINEDGTIRLIMQDGINSNTAYAFDSAANTGTGYQYFYYSNSDFTTQLNSWYTTNIVNKGYSNKVVAGNYYCQQAKVKYMSDATSGSATMTVYSSYTPTFKCSNDGNFYGIVNSNIGLITYDEVVHAGGYYGKDNSNSYLYNGNNYWTMSPSGVVGYNYPSVWTVTSTGKVIGGIGYYEYSVRPVINLKADTLVTGIGTSTDPYIF